MTVDAAAPGKREADERSRAEVEVVSPDPHLLSWSSQTDLVCLASACQASGISGGKIQSDAKGGGIGRSVGGFIDPSLNVSPGRLALGPALR